MCTTRARCRLGPLKDQKSRNEAHLFSYFTHPGDGQGLVEVFATYHAEAPGGRTVQHHVDWHDPLTSPGRAASGTEGEVKEPRTMGGMETLEAWGRGQGTGLD